MLPNDPSSSNEEIWASVPLSGGLPPQVPLPETVLGWSEVEVEDLDLGHGFDRDLPYENDGDRKRPPSPLVC